MSRYHGLRRSEFFDYAADLARRDAARVLRADGRMCQCGHLMHVDMCTEFNKLQSIPTSRVPTYCRCTKAKVMGEAYICCMTGCNRETRVIDGVATFTCDICWQKRQDATNKVLEQFDARRRREGRRI